MVTSVKFVHGEVRRACAGCATAKTRCITSNGGPGVDSSCDRCLLLRKTCTSRPENSKRRKRRTAQAVLAEKIDEVVALLKVAPAPALPGQEGQQGCSPENSPTCDTAALSYPSLIPSHVLTIDVDEANDLLAHFRQHQAAQAPYLEIPPTVTASQLREDKPLVFLAVMTAASHHDAQRQEAFSKASLALLADLVLIKGHKNLGLLQGMELLLGYFHTQTLVNPQMTNLLHLCMAMSVDLGLNQAPAPASAWDSSKGPTLFDGPRRAFQVPGASVQRRTLEERRAYAGCYFLSNVVATSFIITMSTALPWSAQLDEACDVLSQTGIEGDMRLARLAKLQHIGSQISELKKQIMASGHGAVTPLSIYTSPFESELSKLWDDTPEQVQKDTCLALAYHTARMSLYQISLPPTTPSSPPQHTSSIPATISITQTRHLCLTSALAGLEVHLSVPPSRLYHLPLPFFAMTGHVLTTLARLRSCAASVASANDLSDPLRFDLAAAVERTAAHLEQASRSAAEGRNDRLSHWAAWLRRCARALAITDAQPDGGVPHNGGGGGGQDLRGFVAGMEPGRKGEEADGGREVDAARAVGDGTDELAHGSTTASASGYMTPSSALDGGGLPGGDVRNDLLPHDGESFPMEWTAALLDDISGYGLFGLSDDFLMQDMFAGRGVDGFDAGDARLQAQ